MFTDIVGSTKLAEALGDQAWERLLRWHDDMLRDLVARGEGRSSTRPATGSSRRSIRPAGRRVCDLDPAGPPRAPRKRPGSRCRSGSACTRPRPTGAATDYSGIGVHVAARVGALAVGGEILATAETLAEAGDVPASDAATTPVKGVGAPVSVAAIAWN